MSSNTLGGKVRQVHTEIKSARIYQRVDAILKAFDCYITRHSSFLMSFDEGQLAIELQSHGQSYENETVKISFGKKLVFHGEYRAMSEPDCDPRLIIKFPRNRLTFLEIKHYESGAWLRLLSVGKVRQARAKQEKREVEAQEAHLRQTRQEPKQKPRSSDIAVATALGVLQ
ncbi:MAG: hypothetical protein A3D67_04045 [Candidatus Lloydbacteria bacterium RIFCSPHIGHO2_02_FULL_51_22]|uniref:Uncharacterized protein n=1 Tax=Candidatus Lloydbacteria bacterium RIFCSPHIGHO2_02_FULL_51_22 TaxID=1798663 RepID=A0A1G2DAX1_9BACT|nr:MAG: hypothetical protein A3D67_04045 [Candidatus Lloydbacteria bacterium RIFCSPHIGHO2_02_FULL_51_22]